MDRKVEILLEACKQARDFCYDLGSDGGDRMGNVLDEAIQKVYGDLQSAEGSPP